MASDDQKTEQYFSFHDLAETLAAQRYEIWKATGELIRTETYLSKYPGLAEDLEASTALIYGEYWLSVQADRAPRIEDYFEREVKLYVSDRASIGPVTGATPIAFTGDTAPAG